eukprot:8838566-Ditylum_brightwellii.AAC.1
MGCILGQSFFSKYILDKIGQKALRAFTAKCGYNRSMAYAICNGPSHLGGCEFTPLYHLQVAWVQHQSGMSEPILWDTIFMLPYIEAVWLPSLHSYLGATGLQLQLSYTGVYPPQHEHDQHIMSTVINSNAFKFTHNKTHQLL